MKNRIKSIIASTKERTLNVARIASLAVTAPTEKQAQTILFAAGVMALSIGLSDDVFAQLVGGGAGGENILAANGGIEDSRIAAAVATLFTFLEGSFGALIMAASGIAAIVAAAFGQYKAALSCMVCAVGAFILRSVMRTFFNTASVDDAGLGGFN
jgi:hypothetical protein